MALKSDRRRTQSTFIRQQCRRKPEQAAPRNYSNWPSIFWRPF